MGAIDFSNVKSGTYVTIGSDVCKSISIDGEKVWEYTPAPVIYNGDPNDYVGKEADVSGYGYSGGIVTAKLSNAGTMTSVIPPSGSYSYPVGQNKIDMRDGEYFLVMDISMSESPAGSSVSTIRHTLTFKKNYKKVVIPYDIWCDSYSGISSIELKIAFGSDVATIDASDATMGDVTLNGTVASDIITFEWNLYGNLTAKRDVVDLFFVINDIEAYA